MWLYNYNVIVNSKKKAKMSLCVAKHYAMKT
jgi:hypothetical protein